MLGRIQAEIRRLEGENTKPAAIVMRKMKALDLVIGMALSGCLTPNSGLMNFASVLNAQPDEMIGLLYGIPVYVDDRLWPPSADFRLTV